MSIEEAVRKVLGLVALRRLPKDYPEGTGAMLDEMAGALAQRIERSWVELGEQTRHCHPESKEHWDAIHAATLAAFKGDET